MLVSTVIPTYNYARFLPRALDSVFAQTYGNIDCVVVDDGSTDDTQAVLAGYVSRHPDRLRVIRQENRGVSATRNVGIRAARGEAVALLDADDLWKPEKIAKQVALLQERPEVSVVGCGIAVMDAQGRAVREVLMEPPVFGPEGLREMAIRRTWVGGSDSGALLRRSVFDEVGVFDETFFAAEDLDLWLRIAAKCRIANVPETLAIIHQHGTGIFRDAEKMERSQQQVYEAAARRWPHIFDPLTLRRIRARIAVDAGVELATAGRYVRAERRYLHALREWPLDGETWYRAARGLLKIVGI
jgi:glycosyltransferase involved in cell wall biosynthesis